MTKEEAIEIINGRNFSCIECIDRSEECCEALEMAIKALSAEKTTNKININEYVKVKLTDYGKEIFYHQYDNLNKAFGKEIIKPNYPTVDSDGYTSFQLWYFMNLYGRYIDMGVQNVIEPLEIVFESAENTAECDNNHDCEHCDWTECPLEVEKETDGELEALTEFLNDIEEVVQKHGWTIGMYDNLSENDSPSVIITFIPAIGYDSQFRKFGKESKPNE